MTWAIYSVAGLIFVVFVVVLARRVITQSLERIPLTRGTEPGHGHSIIGSPLPNKGFWFNVLRGTNMGLGAGFLSIDSSDPPKEWRVPRDPQAYAKMFVPKARDKH